MTNEHVTIKYYRTCEVIKIQKLLIIIPIRELHNGLIKKSPDYAFAGVRLEPGDLIIVETSLRKFMLPQ